MSARLTDGLKSVPLQAIIATVMDDLLSFFPILSELSIKAAAIIRRYYNSQLEVELKPDDSPVTQADREVEIFFKNRSKNVSRIFLFWAKSSARPESRGACRWIIDLLTARNHSC